jgi:hypothetical protein
MYGGMEVSIRAFLTSTLDGGERSASRLGYINRGVGGNGTNPVGGWVGPKAKLYVYLSDVESFVATYVRTTTMLITVMVKLEIRNFPLHHHNNKNSLFDIFKGQNSTVVCDKCGYWSTFGMVVPSGRGTGAQGLHSSSFVQMVIMKFTYIMKVLTW